MNAEAIGEQMAPILKDMGYKKNRLTWFRKLEELTIVFNIQKSQYADDIWYYQYGIGIHDLAGDRISSISKCDILCRFDQTINGKKLQTEDLRWILERWSEKYGSLERLRAADREGTLPQITSVRVREYLFSHK